MKKMYLILVLALLVLTSQALASKKVTKDTADSKTCYQCHDEIKALKEGSKHAKLDCGQCHGNLSEHLGNPDTKPSTNLGLDNCGRCHKDQYDSYFQVNYHKRAKKEKAIPDGRAPMLDKLLAGHGFTKEHAEPRSHPYMLIDHIIVDRAYGGRFQYKNWADITKTGKAWDILIDTNKTIPESAKAANPTCIQCKTSDFVMKWAYLGDKNPKAKWDRTSNVFEVIKDAQNPVGCIHCHDPHAAKGRVIRDALIQAVQRDGDRPYSKKNDKNALDVKEFRGYRKIGLLKKSDSVLMCAQCHVEYACNPGFEKDDFNKKIGFNDQRTNIFPWKNVFDVLKFYDEINFRDYRHPVTEANLIKFQHPETETFFDSKHERAGATCADCHMAKAKNKAGKTYTSHFVVSPRENIKGTCLKCHKDWTEKQAIYTIDSVKNYIKGKIRKSEYWLSQFIDKFEKAKKAGVSEDVLKEARKQHDIAHAHWEWWTAENSDGFHNPDQARQSLATSIEASKKGIEILDKAIKEKAATASK